MTLSSREALQVALEKKQADLQNHLNPGRGGHNDKDYLAKTESTVGAAGLAITNTAAEGGGTARPSPPRTRGGPRPTCAGNHTTQALTDVNVRNKSKLYLIGGADANVERGVQRQTAHRDGDGSCHRRVRPNSNRAHGKVDAMKVRRIIDINSVANL